MSFTEQLDKEQMEVFNAMSQLDYVGQACKFLDSFWSEVGDQAEFIFSVATTCFREADMRAKGIQYVHQYQPGVDLDFDLGLFFFEQVCKFADTPDHVSFGPLGLHAWAKGHGNFKEEFAKSIPEMQTSIVRKKELREKVDVNFDGRVSLLEYLLYQYEVSPKLLVERSLASGDEHEEITKARAALAEAEAAIKAYEAEKKRLEDISESGNGVKELKAKNELAQLGASPLWEAINVALIKAGAAVRMAVKKYGGVAGEGSGSGGGACQGSLWWMERDLKEKKARYGPSKK
eukprot:TRINITY_DN1849_c1_g1_i1.p2 TRINITY_DN1849_c1_g1~~TRINITY_DN1849_c1_g1_i1.p2  ORF type:complete len:315 (+),score=194.77 TRINITY_DN1849_c1_g1_i1:76-945(+)